MPAGIDVDRTGVRVVQAASGGSSIKILGAAYTSYEVPEEDTLEGFKSHAGGVSLPQEVAQVGVSGKDLNMRHMTLPASDPEQIERMVAMEVEQFAGTHQQRDLEYSYHILGPADENNQYPILIGLLRREWIEEINSSMSERGVKLEACVPKAVACYRTFEEIAEYDSNHYSMDGIVLLAHVGYNTIDTVLIRDGNIVAARNSAGGVSTLLESIAEEGETEGEEYRELWQKVTENSGGGRAFQDRLNQGISALGTRVYSAYNYFKREFEQLPERPGSLYLCGEGARIPEVKKELQNQLEVSVDLFDPTSSCDVSDLPEENLSRFHKLGPEWVVPIGLALSHGTKRGQFLKFPTSTARKRQKWWKKELPALLGMCVLFLALAVYGIKKLRVTQPLLDQQADLNQRLEDLNRRQERYNSIKDRLKRFKSEAGRIRQLQLSGAGLLEALHQVPLYQPDEVRFTDLDLEVRENEPPAIILDGFIEKDVRVALPILKKFRVELNKQSDFRARRRDRPPGGEGITKFSIRLIYNP